VDEAADTFITPDSVIDLQAESKEEIDLDVYLEKLPILCDFSDETKRWLKRHTDVREYAEDDIIIDREGQDQPLCIVADGRAQMITTDKEGQETVVTIIGRGGLFGGISLFQPVRQASSPVSGDDAITVKAATLCIILEIGYKDLSTLAKHEPDFSEALLAEYYKRRADIALARVPLFSYLDPAERGKIADHLTPENVKKDGTIIAEGEMGDTMYLIKSGEVGIYTTLIQDDGVSVIKIDQERLHLATLKAGDFFGEQALITKEPRSATVVALTDVELLTFTKPDLAVVVKQFPRVGTLLKKYHQLRMAETLESLKAIW
jgi:CRP-like cAMP-binding protein